MGMPFKGAEPIPFFFLFSYNYGNGMQIPLALNGKFICLLVLPMQNDNIYAK